MALSVSNKTLDQVEAANLRLALNGGSEWGTSGTTIASVGAAAGGASSSLSTLTSSVGTASATSALVAAGGTYNSTVQGDINNNFQTLATKLNIVLNLLRNLNA